MALGGLSSLFSTIMSAIGASERVFELLDRAPAINLTGGTMPAHAMRGEVHFKGVVFAYPSRPDVTVLSGFELEVQPRQMVALVGHSGAGKSTVFALLNRWYDPGNVQEQVAGMSSGHILVDGMDIRAIDPRWLRSQVAMVAQEPVLFAMSIADNIAYGYRHARDKQAMLRAAAAGEGGEEEPFVGDDDAAEECPRARVEEAARLSNAHNFIEMFPSGKMAAFHYGADITLTPLYYLRLRDFGRGKGAALVWRAEAASRHCPCTTHGSKAAAA
jgi:ABC-type multidrug transport system fused ATPase/permease subunit